MSWHKPFLMYYFTVIHVGSTLGLSLGLGSKVKSYRLRLRGASMSLTTTMFRTRTLTLTLVVSQCHMAFSMAIASIVITLNATPTLNPALGGSLRGDGVVPRCRMMEWCSVTAHASICMAYTPPMHISYRMMEWCSVSARLV